MYPRTLDPTKCPEVVACSSIRMSYHQCRMKVVKDGFCRVHHPDAVKARMAESKRKRELNTANSPYALLQKAEARITELEAEIARLKGQ